MLKIIQLLLISTPLVLGRLEYPKVRRDETVVDDYYGMKIKDPYRWLEFPESKEVKDFIEAQNKITSDYINGSDWDIIHKSLTEAYKYEKYSTLEKAGSRYFFYKNTGLQNQDVLYVQDTLESPPKVFLDPNTLSEDGRVAIRSKKFSKDGELFLYGLSSKGSDWEAVRIRNVTSGNDYPEVLYHVKFSPFEWTKDNLGFFYAQFPNVNLSQPTGSETTVLSNHKLYYHRVGTPQSEDVLMAEFTNHPGWLFFTVKISEDGNYLIVLASPVTESAVYFAKLDKNKSISKLNLIPIVPEPQFEFQYITTEGSVIYFITNEGAPNKRIVGINIDKPEKKFWSTLLPENPKQVLENADAISNDKLVVIYIEDVKSKMELRYLGNGSLIQDIPLDIGNVYYISGKREDNEFFFKFQSFLTPGKYYRVDMGQNRTDYEAKPYREIKTVLDTSKLITKQIFYTSKDGTEVPMFIVHKKDYIPQSNSPAYLYGYGGFGYSNYPHFSTETIAFVQNFDGVYASANIRGGGEYGQRWHLDGRRLKKQNSFDDFQAAAEYLIAQNYTVPHKIVINGASNGGYLVAACLNQRPELYGAVVAQVGDYDLLRANKFTTAEIACSEYGCVTDSKEEFENLYKLSPLHNVKVPKEDKIQYPALLLTTGDHDDRVVPLNSYKLAAELQHTIGSSPKQTNPLLLRVEYGAGHGQGKPTTAVISEVTDIFAFLVKSLGFVFTPSNV